MSLQYAHQRKEEGVELEGTLALEAPSKAFLTQLFTTHSNKTMFLAGLSIKSKKDSFEKKKGREIAVARIVPIVFTLDTIYQEGTKHLYHFYSNNFKIGRQTYHVRVTLTTVAESEQVKLIKMYLDTAISGSYL